MAANHAVGITSGKDMATFYRGITLDPATAAADKAAIWETGLLATKAFWGNTRSSPEEVRRLTPQIAAAPSKVRETIRALPQEPMTYACAYFDDAARYATRKEGLPVVITIDLPLEEVAIDGKDFLYTVFQLWDRRDRQHLPEVREILGRIFGAATVAWFDRAASNTDTMARIGLCDLAVHDLAAITAHHANEIGLAGRYGTLFRSAFDLPAKVDPTAILAVDNVAGPISTPKRKINLHSLISA
ncbi:hypothetical protein A1351_22720 [Methylosinus sp. R-45379]|uniref:hypothetical protein n=1 Tax=Methylosinus sp. R-45379 TaxID=980563 RepID=UPI0007D8339F|nr:hypothetical protein [Methylosinus sp. R-45379]OAI30531.1 hypothetical protein A1351_22720 [Methylosinus sp. R-45379]